MQKVIELQKYYSTELIVWLLSPDIDIMKKINIEDINDKYNVKLDIFELENTFKLKNRIEGTKNYAETNFKQYSKFRCFINLVSTSYVPMIFLILTIITYVLYGYIET